MLAVGSFIWHHVALGLKLNYSGYFREAALDLKSLLFYVRVAKGILCDIP